MQNDEATKVMTASPILKGLAVLLVLVLLARPSVYATLWERKNWYVVLCAAVALPILLPWCARVLIWRVQVSASAIEIRSLHGVLKRQLRELVRVERVHGAVLLAFKDGIQRNVPSFIGDLDGLVRSIAPSVEPKAIKSTFPK